MIDIGLNLLHPQFDGDRDAVLARAHAAGIEAALVTATNLDEAHAAVTLCRTLDAPIALATTAGVHPHDAKDVGAEWSRTLVALLSNPQVRAVGETGLDYFRDFSPRDQQREVFATQLDIAARHDLPVFVHDRDSSGDVHAMLSEHALRRVVVHCFTGTMRDLTRYLDAGYFIGITGWIADRRRGSALRELAAHIPLARLLVETDAPFLRPHNAPAAVDRSRRNEPALLPFVIEAIAQARAEPAATIAAATHANAATLFGFS